jgi:hypothetical protein
MMGLSLENTATYRVVRTILVPSEILSALNWIICPEDNGSEGLYVGGFVVSYPMVKSTTLVMVRPAISRG